MGGGGNPKADKKKVRLRDDFVCDRGEGMKRSEKFAYVVCGCSLRRGSTCQRNAIIKSERRTRASRGGRPACGTRVFSVLSFAKLGHVVQNCTCRMIGSGRSVRSGVEYIRGLEAFFQTTSLLQWHGAEMVEDAVVRT